MMTVNGRKRLMLIAGFATSLSTGSAFAQNGPAAPTETNSIIELSSESGSATGSAGIETTVLGTIPLAAYQEALEGGALRAREVVLPPGAKIEAHRHDQRPAVAHVLEGEIVEYRSDSDAPVIRRAGDTYFEGPDLVHWLENVSPNPVRVFSVDIVPNSSEQ